MDLHHLLLAGLPAHTAPPPEADVTESPRDVAEVPILLQKSLMVSVNSDSVALVRFAAEAGDDGAAEARTGTAVLRVPARRGGTGRSPGARDRWRARSVLGPR